LTGVVSIHSSGFGYRRRHDRLIIAGKIFSSSDPQVGIRREKELHHEATVSNGKGKENLTQRPPSITKEESQKKEKTMVFTFYQAMET
jgi:hypothetical protein